MLGRNEWARLLWNEGPVMCRHWDFNRGMPSGGVALDFNWIVQVCKEHVFWSNRRQVYSDG